MFRGNKPVLILPAILMVLMLLGGYHFLQESESVTNEDLQNIIEVQVSTNTTRQGLDIEANWDWTVMPVEGLYGEDYIGISVINRETGQVRTDIEIENGILELLYANQVIEQTEGTVVENGIIFAFSNQLIEHESYGNIGRVGASIIGEGLEKDDIIVTLLHTWSDHTPLEMEDARFSSPTFTGAANVPHWIVSQVAN
ncbi:hypothetical protein ACFFHM_24305 [Halalkalibacter kiskunsagensis]|uniref:Uncharacterized protein n=1 Tax=Halalkalibacter kiskunsagensis TaxID=1548599 RepID=A0ABV6KJP3_9BACI